MSIVNEIPCGQFCSLKARVRVIHGVELCVKRRDFCSCILLLRFSLEAHVAESSIQIVRNLFDLELLRQEVILDLVDSDV